MKKIQTFRAHGFTLIELIVVIGIFAIIGMLLLAIVNPIEQFKKGQDARRKSDLAQIQRSLEAYYEDFGKYPQSTAAFKIFSVREGSATPVEIDWGSTWKPYMDVVPEDPTTHTYVYWSDNSNNYQSYRMYASLDRGSKDPEACNAGVACVNLPSGASCNGVCNYGISSPNVSP